MLSLLYKDPWIAAAAKRLALHTFIYGMLIPFNVNEGIVAELPVVRVLAIAIAGWLVYALCSDIAETYKEWLANAKEVEEYSAKAHWLAFTVILPALISFVIGALLTLFICIVMYVVNV